MGISPNKVVFIITGIIFLLTGLITFLIAVGMQDRGENPLALFIFGFISFLIGLKLLPIRRRKTTL